MILVFELLHAVSSFAGKLQIHTKCCADNKFLQCIKQYKVDYMYIVWNQDFYCMKVDEGAAWMTYCAVEILRS